MASNSAVPVFVALDVNDVDKARDMVRQLGDAGTHYKVGLELFLSAGRRWVSELAEQGKRVFLDLKFHDIPNTVRSAVREASQLGAEWMTVHALGGYAMLAAAKEGAEAVTGGRTHSVRLLAVTLLTSHAPADLQAIGLKSSDPQEGVLKLASLAQAAELHGVVCSPQEVRLIRHHSHLAAMVPGIRPQDAASNDQHRIATPAEAVAAGATYLVVGRPILQASDPLQALLSIQSEVQGALQNREE